MFRNGSSCNLFVTCNLLSKSNSPLIVPLLHYWKLKNKKTRGTPAFTDTAYFCRFFNTPDNELRIYLFHFFSFFGEILNEQPEIGPKFGSQTLCRGSLFCSSRDLEESGKNWNFFAQDGGDAGQIFTQFGWIVVQIRLKSGPQAAETLPVGSH